MYSKNKLNINSFPKQWLFFNPKKISNTNYFYKITKKMGVVFFCDTNNSHNFYNAVKPYISWCKKKRIKFIVPYSIFCASNFRAFGILVDLNSHKEKNNLKVSKLKNRFFIISKIHNIKEAYKAKKIIDIVFISPVFQTFSFPNKKPLSRYSFISLCFFFKEKIVFALGGVNEKNFSFIKNDNLHGFGGISNFRKSDE